jgi:tripartite-type tricarboxylate transporter receptor subunit TctC
MLAQKNDWGGFGMMRYPLLAAAALCASAALVVGAGAQTFPEKPIHIVVPYPPGGPADTSARLLADIMSRSIGQPVVIDTKPGAASRVATLYVKDAPADGYTLLECTGATVLNTLTIKDLPYTMADLKPVSIFVGNTNVLAVPTLMKVDTLADFIAEAKANPGKLNYGSLGPDGFDEMMTAWFIKSAGVDIVSIPYDGEGPKAAALMANQIQMTFGPLGTVLGQYKAGTLKLLGLVRAERFADHPEIPTLAEQGIPITASGSFLGLCAPADTPDDVVEKLNAEVKKAVADPAYQERVSSLGSEPVASDSPGAFGEFLTAFEKEWTSITAGLGVEKK